MADRVSLTVLDLKAGGRSALQGNGEPVWLPDGSATVTSTGEAPNAGLATQVADGSRPMVTLFTLVKGDAWPTDVSRDAAWLVYYGVERDGSVVGTPDLGDIFVLNRRTNEKRRLVLPGYQRGGRLSPDGRWLAFQSAQRDTWEVHVRPFPSFDADYRLSTDVGDEPAWSADGKELYFRRGPDMMVVKVPPSGAAGAWPPAQVLFTGGFARDHYGDQSYDVARDGRFLMMRPAGRSQIHVEVVFDWMAEVRARLAAGR
jgi:Tol biopolymer transport system component